MPERERPKVLLRGPAEGDGITLAMGIYAFAAAITPVWMLLTPRSYLSTYMKIGTILFLALGVMIVNPQLEVPAFSQFLGGGPVVTGAAFPFVLPAECAPCGVLGCSGAPKRLRWY